MRAGLLSEHSVIELLNENFVSTWVLIDELKNSSDHHEQLAKTLASRWEYPLDLMFLTAEGHFVTKLNSFRDFLAHPDVGHPRHPGHVISSFAPSHSDIFHMHAERFLRNH